jgi:hypothetical protein
MGLYVSHDCFHGTYRAFNRWRKAVAAGVGVKLDEMDGYGGNAAWPGPLTPDDPILRLLAHDDDRGTIPVLACAALADRLEALADKLGMLDQLLDLDHATTTRRFARGLRHAVVCNEDVEFS